MSYSKIPAGKDLPNDIYVAIEIPANHAPIKYEIDKDSDALFVDRFMATPMFYPANYGYIPNTLADDDVGRVEQVVALVEDDPLQRRRLTV